MKFEDFAIEGLIENLKSQIVVTKEFKNVAGLLKNLAVGCHDKSCAVRIPVLRAIEDDRWRLNFGINLERGTKNSCR